MESCRQKWIRSMADRERFDLKEELFGKAMG